MNLVLHFKNKAKEIGIKGSTMTWNELVEDGVPGSAVEELIYHMSKEKLSTRRIKSIISVGIELAAQNITKKGMKIEKF